jgi:hypothetical protein
MNERSLVNKFYASRQDLLQALVALGLACIPGARV